MRLAILGAAIFVSMLGVGIIVPFLPIYAQTMGATGLTLGLIFSAFSLARAVAMPLVGALSDRHGRKRFIVAGLGGYSVVALAMITADSAWDIILLRALHGVFAAMVLPVSMALVADISPSGREGRTFGSFNTALLLGMGMGPFLGGAIYDYFGVAANFIIMAAMSAVSLLMIALKIKDPKAVQEPANKNSAWTNQLILLKDRQIWGICLCRAGNAAAMGCLLAFLPVLSQEKGLSSIKVGLLLGANMFVMTALQSLAGRLADKWPRALMAGSAQLAIALSRMMLPLAGGFETLLILVMLDGIGAGMVIPPLSALAVSHGRRLGSGMGVVMGLLTLAMSVGFFSGPLLAGLVTDIWNINAAFWLAGTLAGLGAVAVLLMTKSKVD